MFYVYYICYCFSFVNCSGNIYVPERTHLKALLVLFDYHSIFTINSSVDNVIDLFKRKFNVSFFLFRLSTVCFHVVLSPIFSSFVPHMDMFVNWSCWFLAFVCVTILFVPFCCHLFSLPFILQPPHSSSLIVLIDYFLNIIVTAGTTTGGESCVFEVQLAERQLSRGEATVYEQVRFSGKFRGPKRRPVWGHSPGSYFYHK